jgi:putative ABC transport system ATP-binding protein
MLEHVGRPVEFLARRSSDLSGGEAQIVALLRTLQLDSTVLLLDEPTASLDAATAGTIEQLVSHWHDQAGNRRAVLWVTHDRDQSCRVANRILEMNSGRITNGV